MTPEVPSSSNSITQCGNCGILHACHHPLSHHVWCPSLSLNLSLSLSLRQQKKSKPKKQKTQDESDDENEFCIVCLESFCRPREVWLQCWSCKGLAHKSCTDGRDFYTCHTTVTRTRPPPPETPPPLLLKMEMEFMFKPFEVFYPLNDFIALQFDGFTSFLSCSTRKKVHIT